MAVLPPIEEDFREAGSAPRRTAESLSSGSGSLIAPDASTAPEPITEEPSSFGRFEPKTGDPSKVSEDLLGVSPDTAPPPPAPISLEPDKTLGGTSTFQAPAPEVKDEPAPKPISLDEDKTVTTQEAFKPPSDTDTDKTINSSLESLRDDIDTNAMEFIKQMMEGDDPIAEAAFNWQIQKLGPMFSANNDALILKLRSQGIEGTNAGNAWLNNMAQQQGVQVSDLIGKINYESARRIEEWNRYGPERANAILDNRLNYNVAKYDFGMQQINDQRDLGSTNPQDYLNIAAANGVTMSPETAQFVADNIASENKLDEAAAIRELNSNYYQMEKDLEGLVPGLSINGLNYNSLTPEQQADLRARLKEINTAIKSNDVALAQELMAETKELYPEAVVGNYDGWNPNDFRTFADQIAINTWTDQAKFQYNNGNIDDAAKILVNKVIDPTTVESQFAKLWETSSPERQSEILESAGLDGEPITDEEKALYMAHDMLSGMNKTTTDEIFKSYYNNAKGVEIDGVPLQQWLMEPENETMTRSWIFQVTSGPYELDENGLIVPVAGQQLPPWNPDSNNAHYFTDWAMADSFDSETGELNITYSGNNVYEDDNEFQTDDGYMNYRSQMDDAWEEYKKAGGGLDRQSWFEDVKPVWDGDSVVFNGEAATSFGAEDAETTNNGIVINPDPNQALENTTNFLNLTKNPDAVIRDEDVVFSIDQTTGTASLPNSRDSANAFLEESSSGLATNPDGWINFEGTALQLQDGGVTSTERRDVAVYNVTEENGGGSFSLGEDGKWYVGDLRITNDISLEDYQLAGSEAFKKLELPKPPSEMTSEELAQWGEYGDYIEGIISGPPKAAGVGTPISSGPKLSGWGQVLAAPSFEEWIAQGKPEFEISKDTATDIYQDLNT